MPAVGASAVVPARSAVRLGLFAAALVVAIDAGLASVLGDQAISPGPSVPPAAWAAIAIAGAGAAVGLAFGGAGSFGVMVRRSRPQLLPFGGELVQLGGYGMLLLVLGAIVQATVVVFSGADVSGAVVGPGGPTPYELLLLGASGLLWALATIGVLAMWRYIRIGRAVDRARGVDPFAGPDTEPWPSEPTWKPDRAPIPPPAAGSDRAIAVVTVVLFLGATVGLQLLQTPLGPPAVPLFWGSMAASVPIALGIARGLSVVDAGVREIEHRYADVVRSGRG